MSGSSVLLCNGCCCGHQEQGHPALPRIDLQTAWATGGLEDAVRLRFVDCLGPCERANVAVVKLPGQDIWLGDLDTADYGTLAAWAADAHGAATHDPSGAPPPLPASLLAHRIPPRGPAS